MNGALTIGTLDGANVEIREEVGPENFFLFGLTEEEVAARRAEGYNPHDYYLSDDRLRDAIDLLRGGFFSSGDSELFRGLTDGLLHHDPYLLFADFASYVDCQQQVSEAFLDRDRWTRMSILNAARSGKFSSDRSISQYCEDIWDVKPVPVRLLAQKDDSPGFIQ